MDSDANVVTK